MHDNCAKSETNVMNFWARLANQAMCAGREKLLILENSLDPIRSDSSIISLVVSIASRVHLALVVVGFVMAINL